MNRKNRSPPLSENFSIPVLGNSDLYLCNVADLSSSFYCENKLWRIVPNSAIAG